MALVDTLAASLGGYKPGAGAAKGAAGSWAPVGGVRLMRLDARVEV